MVCGVRTHHIIAYILAFPLYRSTMAVSFSRDSFLRTSTCPTDSSSNGMNLNTTMYICNVCHMHGVCILCVCVCVCVWCVYVCVCVCGVCICVCVWCVCVWCVYVCVCVVCVCVCGVCVCVCVWCGVCMCVWCVCTCMSMHNHKPLICIHYKWGTNHDTLLFVTDLRLAFDLGKGLQYEFNYKKQHN